MGRFDTLMYDNRNWKGTIALLASMLIGLAVSYKGFDELPAIQDDRRAAALALHKAQRILDKQAIHSSSYTKAAEQVNLLEHRVTAANLTVYLSNITFGLGLVILGIALVVYVRRSQGIVVQYIQSDMAIQPTMPSIQPATPRLAA